MVSQTLLRCIALFLAFWSHALLAKGVNITVHCKNGEQHGELYSLSDSSFVLGWSEAGKERLEEFKYREIRHVVVNDKPELRLLLAKEEQITGKLCAVSDSSLFVIVREAAPGRASSNFGKHVFEVKNREIKLAMVKLKGRSHKLAGAGLGLLAGTVVGAVAGTYFLTRDKDDVGDFFDDLITSGWVAIGGAVGGTIAGAQLGAASSTPPKEGEASMSHAYAVLKPLARYAEHQR
ncbi:MAG: hypothetical protein ONA90_06320 [candidate division KSB1 bacterium]|nr:hypothetical protein [candidate division KSB1 bacterium]